MLSESIRSERNAVAERILNHHALYDRIVGHLDLGHVVQPAMDVDSSAVQPAERGSGHEPIAIDAIEPAAEIALSSPISPEQLIEQHLHIVIGSHVHCSDFAAHCLHEQHELDSLGFRRFWSESFMGVI